MDRQRVAKELVLYKSKSSSDKLWTKSEWNNYKKEHPGTQIKPKFAKIQRRATMENKQLARQLVKIAKELSAAEHGFDLIDIKARDFYLGLGVV